ncbi:MAG: hypothetical protein H6718_12655 [Polyangiaceae bacterium]|nr:hypothetical protein [Myxococcales bacterium]MCB9586245.1 hypothetical protein [Polyangiaceae bacterium]MCB9606922.1 hypothetical protein [Polyangiaceae bacterium]
MAIFGGGSGAASEPLECPHCHEVQLRAREAHRLKLVCRACKRTFSLIEGRERYAKSQALKRRR